MRASCLALTLFLSTTAVQTPHAQTATYSRKDLQTMRRAAHSQQEYEKLQGIFHEQAEHFHKLALDEDAQIKQELEHPAMASKYPMPLGRAKQLREYYEERDRQSRALEAEYARKAAAAAPAPSSPAQP